MFGMDGLPVKIDVKLPMGDIYLVCAVLFVGVLSLVIVNKTI